MSPEEEHREELKWVLQKIKKELLHAGPDNLVDFNASRLTNRDPDSPSLDTVYKHIKDIERATVIRMVERYDGDGFDVYPYSLDVEAGVTGYKFVVDREKFEIFYHNIIEVKVHRKDLKSDDAVDFDEEKERISAIKYEGDHKLELNRWMWMKNILDQIYVQLSPNASHGQTVRSIDISKVPESISRGILDDLWDRGICGYGGPFDEQSGRVTMRKGNHILIRDIDRFRTYRNGVSDFVKWIKQDGVERFSEKETGGHAPSDGTPLEKLSQINFLSVCDIAMDIEEKLQMTDKDVVYIPVVKKNNIRFPILLPAVAANLFDEYGDNRVGAAIYLKNNGSIVNYEFQRGLHKWDTNMKIMLEPKKFRRFYEGLQAVYQERVVDPARKATGQGFQADEAVFTQNDKGRAADNPETRKSLKRIENVTERESSRAKLDMAVKSELFTAIEKRKGYFKFYKEGEKILVGGADTRPFLVLQCLCDPFGAYKSIEAIFEKARIASDVDDPKLRDWSPDKREQMVQKLKNSGVKELQKIKKMQGKIAYEFNTNETQLRIMLLEE